MEQIRADFIAHFQSVCLIIDDAYLQSIRNTFDEPENNRGSWAPTGFVGVVDPDYAEGQSYDNMEYRGFMRAQITCLNELVARQLGYFSMHEICPIMYHDMHPRVVNSRKVPLYKGLGSAQNFLLSKGHLLTVRFQISATILIFYEYPNARFEIPSLADITEIYVSSPSIPSCFFHMPTSLIKFKCHSLYCPLLYSS